jgi:hypothetical protein
MYKLSADFTMGSLVPPPLIDEEQSQNNKDDESDVHYLSL